MKVSRTLLVLTVVMLFLTGLLLGIYLWAQKTEILLTPENVEGQNQFSPLNSIGFFQQITDDEKARYVLADIALGCPESYYEAYREEDPGIALALAWLASGEQILNLDQFERVPAENAGWQVIDRQTQQPIYGDMIILKSDIGFSSQDAGLCNQLFWPIYLGSQWRYEYLPPTIGEFTHTVSARQLREGRLFFTITYRQTPIPFDYQYSCDETGIYAETADGVILILPSDPLMNIGREINGAKVLTLTKMNTALGNLPVILVRQGAVVRYFAAGVGLVAQGWAPKVFSDQEIVEYPDYVRVDFRVLTYSGKPDQTASSTSDNVGDDLVRYYLADMQLGDLVDDYRDLRANPQAQDAVSLWDQGVRVQNIEQFERYLNPSTGEWFVVYAGAGPIASGREIALSTDMPIVILPAGCANPYWPLKVGASWTYEQKITFPPKYWGTYTYTRTLVALHSFGERAVITFNQGDGIFKTYFCTQDGILDSAGTLILPTNPPVLVVQMTVPAGRFDTVRFACESGEMVIVFGYDVGPIFSETSGNLAQTTELQSYSWP